MDTFLLEDRLAHTSHLHSPMLINSLLLHFGQTLTSEEMMEERYTIRSIAEEATLFLMSCFMK